MRIEAVGSAFPEHYYSQDQLLGALKAVWAGHHYNVERLESIHRNTLVGGRYLTLPLEAYPALRGFAAANDRFIEAAVELGGRSIDRALAASGLGRADVDHLFFVSVTGIATPSVDGLLANRMRLSPYVKRTPIFGLGCVAGAAGIARAADYLRGAPGEVAVLLSVELCCLTMQPDDLSVANIVSSGLFGDGAAAVVMLGSERGGSGPEVLATRAVLYPDSEDVMGWQVTDRGFRVVLKSSVPDMVLRYLRRDVDAFLAEQGLARRDIGSWVSHPGGPKVLEAIAEALELGPGALDASWHSLRTIGNLSSASVLMVLADTMRERRPAPGTLGVLLAMGPGFSAEMALLRW